MHVRALYGSNGMLWIFLIYGTVNSVMFALVAVGFTLVYGVSRLPNFAHGALYVLVGFLTWSFVNDFKLFYPLAILISLGIPQYWER